ncbi:nucleotidyltransferase [Halobacillus sp. ACCC02827]|uniref:nucleotidyltransferase n=1 Tax=Halobacillus sp. ACCC02827 TaxID=3052090 RepID=UPI0025708D58|nr:nucleotidyltransferase [Halobacillus sp. ACCC02827]WJE17360.1 nucleotidyltransferase [Halobacillus sp. ACCC02827]
MKSCGVVVEYNPFHNGHYYHLQQARKQTEADCIVAVMSGPFLQRGEPAIIDKWHRTKAALRGGADLVVELPFLYAVQNSDFFSKGAIRILADLGVQAVCFGSESGRIDAFLQTKEQMELHEDTYQETLRKSMAEGLSFPEASRLGYEAIDFPDGAVDMSQPNNILGLSYLKEIAAYAPHMDPVTILRKDSHYHEEDITGTIASATSIRRELLKKQCLTEAAVKSLRKDTVEQLHSYRSMAGVWHEWERYFQLLQYKVGTMEASVLRSIHGVDEGLEYRLKRLMKDAVSFQDFMDKVKTKRYTWTRLQRTLVHILVGTDKETARRELQEEQPPYARVLGMNEHGRSFLKEAKKTTPVPVITQPQQLTHPLLELEERATAAYYAPLAPKQRTALMKREYQAPVIL